jgi:hypothetical protein
VMTQSRHALKNSVRIWFCSCERSGAIGGVEPIQRRRMVTMTGERLDSSPYAKS